MEKEVGIEDLTKKHHKVRSISVVVPATLSIGQGAASPPPPKLAKSKILYWTHNTASRALQLFPLSLIARSIAPLLHKPE